MYKVRLANPTDFYFDHQAKLFLDYYRPVGETNVLSEQLKKAVKFKKLVDLNGNVLVEEKEEVTGFIASDDKVKLDVKVEAEEVKASEVKEEAITEKEDVKDESKASGKTEKAKPKANSRKASNSEK